MESAACTSTARARGGALILMMGGNGVDDLLAFIVLFRQIRADQGVRSLDFMIHRLAAHHED